MKKGCFFSVIIFLTIAIGIGFYLYKKYSPQIKDFSKRKLVEISSNEINNKISELKNSIYKDSLKIYFEDQIEILKNADFNETINEFGRISEQIKFSLDDGVIDSTEFLILKNMALINERPKKN